MRLLLTWGLFITLIGNLPAADWPQWRGPLQNGISAETVSVNWPEAGPAKLWTVRVGTGFSGCVVQDDHLVTMGNEDDRDLVICLQASTGKELWRHTYPSPLDPNLFEGGPTSTPTIANGRVYTLSRRGHACCLDLKSGLVAWELELQEQTEANIPAWGFAAAPVVTSSGILLNMGSHGLLVNAGDGSIIWKSDNEDDAGYATPVLIPGTKPQQALILSGKSLQQVRVDTGDIVWQYRWITRYGVNAADPHLVSDGILLSSGYGKGATLLKVGDSAEAPSEVWRSRELRNQMSPGVVIDGYIYAVDGDAGTEPSLKCLKVATGEVQWTEEGLGSATLFAAGDQLIILSDQGELLIAAASPQEFTARCRARVLDGKCWTVPTLANGQLYCRNAEGTLICLNVVSP